MEYGMTFVKAPKSSIAFSKRVFPIVHRMVKVPESFHFGESSLWRTAKMFSPTLTFSSPFSFCLLVHNSLRNLLYSIKKRNVDLDFLKSIHFSFSFSSFLVLEKWLGNGRVGTTGGIESLKNFFGGPSLSIGAVVSTFSIEESFCHFVSPLASLALRGISSSCFPFLKVIALTFSFGFIIV